MQTRLPDLVSGLTAPSSESGSVLYLREGLDRTSLRTEPSARDSAFFSTISSISTPRFSS